MQSNKEERELIRSRLFRIGQREKKKESNSVRGLLEELSLGKRHRKTLTEVDDSEKKTKTNSGRISMSVGKIVSQELKFSTGVPVLFFYRFVQSHFFFWIARIRSFS